MMTMIANTELVSYHDHLVCVDFRIIIVLIAVVVFKVLRG